MTFVYELQATQSTSISITTISRHQPFKEQVKTQDKMTTKAPRLYCDYLGDDDTQIRSSDNKPEDITQLIKVAHQHIREEPHSRLGVDLRKLNSEYKEAVEEFHKVQKVVKKATMMLLSVLQKTCRCELLDEYAESEEPPVSMSAWDCEKEYGRKVRNVRDLVSDMEKCGKGVAELFKNP
jgi:hypothetical protein